MRARWAVPLSLLSLVLGVGLVCPGGEGADLPVAESDPAADAAPLLREEDLFTTGEDALTLEGRVVDPAGAPVANAEVSLSASAEEAALESRCPHCGLARKSCLAAASFEQVAHAWEGETPAALLRTRTGSDGRFRFQGLRRVSFAVWAQADGFGEGVRERAAPGEPLELRLTPARVLGGRVVDEEGRGLAGARIVARSRIPVRYLAQSGADGSFALTVGDGPFYLVADAPGRVAAGRNQVSVGTGAVELVLPRERTLEVVVTRGGAPADAAIRVVGDHLEQLAQTEGGYLKLTGLAPGTLNVFASAGTLAATAHVELRRPSTRAELVLGAGGTLAVTVLDPAGQPVPQPRLTLQAHQQVVAEVQAATGERVLLGPVPHGAYGLTVRAPGFSDHQVEVQLEGGERTLDVVLEPGAVVSGRVVDEYGRPAGGVIVNVSPTGEGETTGPDGRFAITLPMPGVYELNAHHSDWGGTDAKVTAPADGVELALQSKAGVRAVITSGGLPLEGGAVLMRGGEDVFFSDRPSGADGVALMRGLPPGEYLVGVTHPDHLPSAFQRVVLPEGQTVEVPFALSPGARIGGQIRDEQGRPIPGVAVIALGHNTVGGEPSTTTGEGRFSVGPLRPDRNYRLQITHPDYQTPPVVTARADGPALEITLQGKQRFLGKVVGKGQGPVPRFTVDQQEFTAPDGRFEAMLAAEQGQVTFVVSAPGYVAQAFTLPAQPQLGTLELDPSPRISGRVVDPSGAPVADAQVGCELCDSGALTREDGRFQLAAAGDGEFEVTARKGNQAVTVRTRPGEPLILQLQNGATARVRVFDALGNPAAGEAVEASDQQGGSRTLVTGPDGSAQASFPPGQYFFQLTRQTQAALRLRVEESTQEIVLGAAPGTGSLQVQVAGHGFVVWVVPGHHESVADPQQQFLAAPRAYVAQYVRNQVVFTGLPPGEYTVVATPGYRSAGSLRIGHAQVTVGQTVLNLR